MKPKQRQDFLKDLRERGYIEHNGTLYPPNQAAALGIVPAKKTRSKVTGQKTGWIDDYRNIRNREAQKDMFIRMIEQELGVNVWPEFFFSVEREFRIDYAIPSTKLAIEVDGGIWCKGNSGHSSGTGIKRDQEKTSLLAAHGWKLIRITPDELLTNYTIELIKKSISHAQRNLERYS